MIQGNPLPAPGAPGISPRWTTSSKDGVGTALGPGSSVSFTLSHGILNEIYFPRTDKAATRDMGLIVTNGTDFFSEEKRNTKTETRQIAPGVPAFTITNICAEGRYKITKQVVTDPIRDCVLQRIKFKANRKDQYQIYGLLAPHLDNRGMGNTAWVADFKGHPMIFAKNNDVALAFICSVPWKKRSVGFVGTSDGWQDLWQHYQMTWEYTLAENGNVALMGEVDLNSAEDQVFDLVIGFGATAEEAAHHALSSMLEGFGSIQKKYIAEWKNWQHQIRPLSKNQTNSEKLFRLSASVLKTHESKNFPGAMLASLSIPWGDSMGDDDESGYHLVWPRDMVECAGGLLALGANEDSLRVLNFLMATQEADGHWSQNMWLDGQPYWSGVQVDETALPILLIDLCMKQGALHENHLNKYWATVKKATAYLLTRGLVTEQDRWEEQSGISAFTISTTIAALLVAANLAEQVGERSIAEYCRHTADAWNDSIETWLYATNTPLSGKLGVDGYYLRINPTKNPAAELGDSTMKVKNKPGDQDVIPVTEMVSIDPLALVRFGLRKATDPRILNTVKVIDSVLKTETPYGDCWYRYVNDGYGEHEDGSAYNGTGIGRPWPLLTAERAHYEIAAGNQGRAKELLRAVENFSNNGLFPEQIWDSPDIPHKELFSGKRSGSAMPLVWAHAEYIKLALSVNRNAVFDMPHHTVQRYLVENKTSKHSIWRPELPILEISSGKELRLETVYPAMVRWTTNGWQNAREDETLDMGLGVHYLDLPTQKMEAGEIRFSIFSKENKQEPIEDFAVRIRAVKPE